MAPDRPLPTVASLEGHNFHFNLNLDESSEPPLEPKTIRVEVSRLIPERYRALSLFGVLGVYFTLLTSWWGRTVGKWVARIRVVRLDGHRLSLLESLERFGGYLHIPASLFLPLVDLWRDPNRRLPHDRSVHTAVIRTRPAASNLPAGLAGAARRAG